jgi:YfiH family protein
VTAIGKGFPKVAPQSFAPPWLVAFTTLATHDGQPLDFTAGKGEGCRRELEQALAPLALTWLTLEHGNKFVIFDSNNAEKVRAFPRNGSPAAGEPAASFLGADAPAAAEPAASPSLAESPVADAAIITQAGRAVAFTTADCLPIVCVDTRQHLVAAIHAGWRSLAAGIVEKVLECLIDRYEASPEALRAWIGPAIAGEDYEVGSEVRDALLARPAITEAHFAPSPGNPAHFLADLPAAATAILVSLGLSASAIERCPVSTKTDPLLHSVRRDGAQAGRMATVVGIAAQ